MGSRISSRNCWRLVPDSIAVAVDARLGLLPELTARFLGFAAMLGRNFDWHVVAAATGCPPLEAIGLLRQAARAQLIDTDGAGFRFRHALTAEAGSRTSQTLRTDSAASSPTRYCSASAAMCTRR